MPITPTRSLAERMTDTGGRSSGFDYLRLGLAVAIVCWHSILFCYGPEADASVWVGPLRPLPAMMLPVFFALSGFLVAGSLERCNTLVSFFGLRVLRIVPALAMEVTLSALLLGPLLTEAALGTYFTSPEFFHYFLNIVGDIHFTLPGLFPDNPTPGLVNGQLWTIPFELQCYLALGLLALIGAVRRRGWLLGIMAVLQTVALWHAATKPVPTGGAVTGAVLVLSFLAGVTVYSFRDRLPWSWRWAAVAAVAVWVLLDIRDAEYAAPFPVAYLTAYLGLANPRKPRFLFASDYSYGIYLYGSPVAQGFVSLGPGVRHWYWYLLAVLPAAWVIAYVSWNRIEKPALGLRRYLPAIEMRLIALTSAVIGPAWTRLAALRPVAMVAEVAQGRGLRRGGRDY